MIGEIQSVATSGPSDVLSALRNASRKTGLAFDYLLNTAMRESNLKTDAQSKTSSATGLFQFIEQTWLGLVKRFGERHGLSEYADAIEQNGKGQFKVASAETKAAILALRKDPELSAVMAGESAKQTKQSLEGALGREVCEGELYAAHVFGPAGARELIKLKEASPDAPADLSFPKAAKANKSIFYRADGSAKSVSEVYAWCLKQPAAKALPSLRDGIPALRDGTPSLRGTTPALRDSTPALIAENTAPKQPQAIRVPYASPKNETQTTTPTEDPADQEPQALQPIYAARGYLGWFADAAPAPLVRSSLPQSPLTLTPGIVEILASLSPASAARRS